MIKTTPEITNKVGETLDTWVEELEGTIKSADTEIVYCLDQQVKSKRSDLDFGLISKILDL